MSGASSAGQGNQPLNAGATESEPGPSGFQSGTLQPLPPLQIGSTSSMHQMMPMHMPAPGIPYMAPGGTYVMQLQHYQPNPMHLLAPAPQHMIQQPQAMPAPGQSPYYSFPYGSPHHQQVYNYTPYAMQYPQQQPMQQQYQMQQAWQMPLAAANQPPAAHQTRSPIGSEEDGMQPGTSRQGSGQPLEIEASEVEGSPVHFRPSGSSADGSPLVEAQAGDPPPLLIDDGMSDTGQAGPSDIQQQQSVLTELLPVTAQPSKRRSAHASARIAPIHPISPESLRSEVERLNKEADEGRAETVKEMLQAKMKMVQRKMKRDIEKTKGKQEDRRPIGDASAGPSNQLLQQYPAMQQVGQSAAAPPPSKKPRFNAKKALLQQEMLNQSWNENTEQQPSDVVDEAPQEMTIRDFLRKKAGLQARRPSVQREIRSVSRDVEFIQSTSPQQQQPLRAKQATRPRKRPTIVVLPPVRPLHRPISPGGAPANCPPGPSTQQPPQLPRAEPVETEEIILEDDSEEPEPVRMPFLVQQQLAAARVATPKVVRKVVVRGNAPATPLKPINIYDPATDNNVANAINAIFAASGHRPSERTEKILKSAEVAALKPITIKDDEGHERYIIPRKRRQDYDQLLGAKQPAKIVVPATTESTSAEEEVIDIRDEEDRSKEKRRIELQLHRKRRQDLYAMLQLQLPKGRPRNEEKVMIQQKMWGFLKGLGMSKKDLVMLIGAVKGKEKSESDGEITTLEDDDAVEEEEEQDDDVVDVDDDEEESDTPFDSSYSPSSSDFSWSGGELDDHEEQEKEAADDAPRYKTRATNALLQDHLFETPESSSSGMGENADEPEVVFVAPLPPKDLRSPKKPAIASPSKAAVAGLDSAPHTSTVRDYIDEVEQLEFENDLSTGVLLSPPSSPSDARDDDDEEEEEEDDAVDDDEEEGEESIWTEDGEQMTASQDVRMGAKGDIVMRKKMGRPRKHPEESDEQKKTRLWRLEQHRLLHKDEYEAADAARKRGVRKRFPRGVAWLQRRDTYEALQGNLRGADDAQKAVSDDPEDLFEQEEATEGDVSDVPPFEEEVTITEPAGGKMVNDVSLEDGVLMEGVAMEDELIANTEAPAGKIAKWAVKSLNLYEMKESMRYEKGQKLDSLLKQLNAMENGMEEDRPGTSEMDKTVHGLCSDLTELIECDDEMKDNVPSTLMEDCDDQQAVKATYEEQMTSIETEVTKLVYLEIIVLQIKMIVSFRDDHCSLIKDQLARSRTGGQDLRTKLEEYLPVKLQSMDFLLRLLMEELITEIECDRWSGIFDAVAAGKEQEYYDMIAPLSEEARRKAEMLMATCPQDETEKSPQKLKNKKKSAKGKSAEPLSDDEEEEDDDEELEYDSDVVFTKKYDENGEAIEEASVPVTDELEIGIETLQWPPEMRLSVPVPTKVHDYWNLPPTLAPHPAHIHKLNIDRAMSFLIEQKKKELYYADTTNNTFPNHLTLDPIFIFNKELHGKGGLSYLVKREYDESLFSQRQGHVESLFNGRTEIFNFGKMGVKKTDFLLPADFSQQDEEDLNETQQEVEDFAMYREQRSQGICKDLQEGKVNYHMQMTRREATAAIHDDLRVYTKDVSPLDSTHGMEFIIDELIIILLHRKYEMRWERYLSSIHKKFNVDTDIALLSREQQWHDGDHVEKFTALAIEKCIGILLLLVFRTCEMMFFDPNNRRFIEPSLEQLRPIIDSTVADHEILSTKVKRMMSNLLNQENEIHDKFSQRLDDLNITAHRASNSFTDDEKIWKCLSRLRQFEITSDWGRVPTLSSTDEKPDCEWLFKHALPEEAMKPMDILLPPFRKYIHETRSIVNMNLVSAIHQCCMDKVDELSKVLHEDMQELGMLEDTLKEIAPKSIKLPLVSLEPALRIVNSPASTYFSLKLNKRLFDEFEPMNGRELDVRAELRRLVVNPIPEKKKVLRPDNDLKKNEPIDEAQKLEKARKEMMEIVEGWKLVDPDADLFRWDDDDHWTELPGASIAAVHRRVPVSPTRSDEDFDEEAVYRALSRAKTMWQARQIVPKHLWKHIVPEDIDMPEGHYFKETATTTYSTYYSENGVEIPAEICLEAGNYYLGDDDEPSTAGDQEQTTVFDFTEEEEPDEPGWMLHREDEEQTQLEIVARLPTGDFEEQPANIFTKRRFVEIDHEAIREGMWRRAQSPPPVHYAETGKVNIEKALRNSYYCIDKESQEESDARIELEGVLYDHLPNELLPDDLSWERPLSPDSSLDRMARFACAVAKPRALVQVVGENEEEEILEPAVKKPKYSDDNLDEEMEDDDEAVETTSEGVEEAAGSPREISAENEGGPTTTCEAEKRGGKRAHDATLTPQLKSILKKVEMTEYNWIDSNWNVKKNRIFVDEASMKRGRDWAAHYDMGQIKLYPPKYHPERVLERICVVDITPPIFRRIFLNRRRDVRKKSKVHPRNIPSKMKKIAERCRKGRIPGIPRPKFADLRAQRQWRSSMLKQKDHYI